MCNGVLNHRSITNGFYGHQNWFDGDDCFERSMNGIFEKINLQCFIRYLQCSMRQVRSIIILIQTNNI